MSVALELAKRDAEIARNALMDDVRQLQLRLQPTNLADEAIESVKAKGWRAIALARRNPIATTAGVAGLLLLAARKPVIGLIRRWLNNNRD